MNGDTSTLIIDYIDFFYSYHVIICLLAKAHTAHPIMWLSLVNTGIHSLMPGLAVTIAENHFWGVKWRSIFPPCHSSLAVMNIQSEQLPIIFLNLLLFAVCQSVPWLWVYHKVSEVTLRSQTGIRSHRGPVEVTGPDKKKPQRSTSRPGLRRGRETTAELIGVRR